ncbi:glycosyltransferase family 2 protein [Paractinoplanes rishiriensis]|uniref:glycosyltransferase family 2 protein n=1 Tax=Paractinoplanes rishiriensis TaxID=1050105 RepID=UPI001943DE75|nr:glycosyltransferase [Actinoplanes rishiriensis]
MVPALRNVVACLRHLAVPAAIAVVDCGSSDRTLERVDGLAAESPVPVRTVGCSRPGWHAAALRGITSTAARWVALGEPDDLGSTDTAGFDHAVRMLAAGDRHVVCLGSRGRRSTVLEVSAAATIVREQAPDGPGFVPDLPDSVWHAGLRIAAVGRVAGPARADLETTAVVERVAV